MDDLLDKILMPENMRAATDEVRKNKGAPGVDKMPVEELMGYFALNESAVIRQIKTYHRVRIINDPRKAFIYRLSGAFLCPFDPTLTKNTDKFEEKNRGLKKIFVGDLRDLPINSVL